MAEMAVKKTTDQNPQGATGAQRGGEISRRTTWDPFLSITPSEFFSSSPFSMMRRLSEEMDRSFGRFFSREEGESFWAPAVDVTESNGQLKVHAELPGLKPEDVHVEVQNDQLVIQGERKFEHEEKGDNVYRSERRYGRFYRAIPLPEGANTEQAKAQFQNGVLEVSIAVPEKEKSSSRREIPIETK